MNPPSPVVPLQKHVLLGRQPIFDRNQRVVAFELLQRVAEGERWESDDSVLTRQVMRKAIFDFGLDQLVKGRDLFLNVGAATLTERDYLLFPAERTVLEILERVTVSDQLLADVATARGEGYRVALDDYVGDPAFDPLLPFVDFVKLDVMNRSIAQLRATIDHAQALAPRATLLAEKVETAEELQFLLTTPISLFQGYFFRKPALLQTAAVQGDHEGLLFNIAGALSDPDIGLDELGGMISAVPHLTMQVLRLANSASVGVNRRLSGVTDAIITIGLTNLRRLLYILLATTCNKGHPELVIAGLTRARTCELLAEGDQTTASQAFIVGLFSLMEAAMGKPLADLIDDLHFAPPIEEALLGDDGPLWPYLRCALALEGGGGLPLAPEQLSRPIETVHLEAIVWAEQIRDLLSRNADS